MIRPHEVNGRHAVVIGGSMAGLLAARVLADRFDTVTIVERDRLEPHPGFRPGVPQSRHQHILLPRGRQAIERLLPGFEATLLEAGAELIDMAGDVHWVTPLGPAPRFDAGIRLIQGTRDLIEWTTRQRVTALPNVGVRDRAEVTGLVAAGGAVTGVRLRDRDADDDRVETLQADLVVDASGRRSRAPRWLEEIGGEAPPETVIDARPGYATRLFDPPADTDASWRVVLVQPALPGDRRGGVLSPVEGGRWMCSLIGLGGNHPPTDEIGFLAFARSLRDPALYRAIRAATPISPVHGYRNVENRLRRFDHLSDQPDQFIVTGDAACCFNPVYGQGMTIAALGAEALAACLDASVPGAPGFARRFQRALAKAQAPAWLLASGEDQRVPGVEGARAGLPDRVARRYMELALARSMHDQDTRRLMLQVFAMDAPPSALFRPRVMARVLREGLSPRRPPAAPPATGDVSPPRRQVRQDARRAG